MAELDITINDVRKFMLHEQMFAFLSFFLLFTKPNMLNFSAFLFGCRKILAGIYQKVYLRTHMEKLIFLLLY